MHFKNEIDVSCEKVKTQVETESWKYFLWSKSTSDRTSDKIIFKDTEISMAHDYQLKIKKEFITSRFQDWMIFSKQEYKIPDIPKLFSECSALFY